MGIDSLPYIKHPSRLRDLKSTEQSVRHFWDERAVEFISSTTRDHSPAVFRFFSGRLHVSQDTRKNLDTHTRDNA